ncbi:hypothetical protein [Deinococcus deserti]|nr:hypothetical protein [Deinococcus deserti]
MTDTFALSLVSKETVMFSFQTQGYDVIGSSLHFADKLDTLAE